MVYLAKHSLLPRLDAVKLLRADASGRRPIPGPVRAGSRFGVCTGVDSLIGESGEEMGPGSRRAIFVSCRRCPGSLRATVSAQLAGRREEPAEAPAVVATKWVVPRPVVLA